MSTTDPSALLDDRHERRRLPLIGLALTALYLCGLVLYLAVQGQNPAELRLDELGTSLTPGSRP